MSELIKRLKEERIQGSDAVLNYSNFDYWVNWDDIVEIVEDHDQPQLNDNQQIAINNAKKSFEKGSDLYDCAIDMMLYDGLTDKEWAKVTVAFLLWVQEQEEE
ncbi:hypothetical protein [Enterococcus gallinarum]|uniref:Phage protein n=1 Tax=Enterococcus gallinarum TaxID=1353 RepID=A0ABD4ZT50_ENTGA|nr:hypothetical protein [Enterococcus gallinarum]MDL4875117.1 hypothetical protein [Enterococcus gallinarum]MDL4880611.1 hypothetical protein [Enterococcus gallinarum]MDL4884160.1 hypothetical protein [Enterococcus gallinarum]MDL4892888.1 hypothetical protein [Enterococcus gallinarum]MDL4920699.1 hypothetical protein [Enterococcus gallinarum]